jgi:hypothetical protein
MKKVLFLSLIISSLIYSTEKRSNQAKEVIDLIYNLQSQIPKIKDKFTQEINSLKEQCTQTIKSLVSQYEELYTTFKELHTNFTVVLDSHNAQELELNNLKKK